MHTWKLSPLGFLLLLFLLGGGMAPVLAQANDRFLDRIVVVVGEDVITERELVSRINLATQQIRQRGMRPADQDAIIRQVAEQLINERVQLQEARRLGIQIDDLTLNRTLEDIAAENQLSLLQLRNALANEGVDFALFRQQIREELTLLQLRRRQVDNRIRVSDQELDDLIAAESGAIDRDVRYRISHILIELPRGADPQIIRTTAQRIAEIRNRALAGEDFQNLALTYSDAPDALEGGDLGWREVGDIPALYARAAVLMNPGEISQALRSANGFHLIRLEAREAGEELMVNQTRVRHILISSHELRTPEEARQHAESLFRRLRDGADFSDLARAHSDDPGSASRGGLLGWVSPGELVPVFEETMDRLPTGQLSTPVLSDFGWHLIEVLDRRQMDATRDVIRARAREILRNRKREDALQRWARQLRDNTFIEYRIEGLQPS